MKVKPVVIVMSENRAILHAILVVAPMPRGIVKTTSV